MLERYRIHPSALFIVEGLLAISPMVGVATLILFDNTTWWSFGDVMLLIGVMILMFATRAKSAHG